MDKSLFCYDLEEEKNILMGLKITEKTEKELRKEYKAWKKWYMQEGYKNNSNSQIRIKNKRTCSKAIVCVETKEMFASIRAASRAKKIDKYLIGECCRDASKTHKGFHWQYLIKNNTKE